MEIIEIISSYINKSNNILNRLNKISLEMFYIYIAIQGRQMIYKNAIKSQLKTNPHPLEKYRVNCPLARLETFRAVYGIKKGDGMWWHNTNTIW